MNCEFPRTWCQAHSCNICPYFTMCVFLLPGDTKPDRVKATSDSPQTPCSLWGLACHSLSMVTRHGRERHTERTPDAALTLATSSCGPVFGVTSSLWRTAAISSHCGKKDTHTYAGWANGWMSYLQHRQKSLNIDGFGSMPLSVLVCSMAGYHNY